MKHLLFVVAVCLSAVAGATDAPPCLDHGSALPINDQQVIDWKHTSNNQFHARAHIQGKLTQLYPDKTGHHHFQMQIEAASPDSIEVIYNEDFGTVPPLTVGARIEACGDYITANKNAGGYSASPDGAIVHWLHKSTSSSHDSGYLIIDGVVTGQN